MEAYGGATGPIIYPNELHLLKCIFRIAGETSSASGWRARKLSSQVCGSANLCDEQMRAAPTA
eukprot:scaffold116107_cov85-Phaeocystis_antarctica.AAC.2